MTYTNSMAVNAVTGTGSLDLYVGGVIETTYTYGSGAFTLSVRPDDIVLEADVAREKIREINSWWVLCQQVLALNYSPAVVYVYKMEETSTNVQWDLTFGEVKIINAKYKRSNGKTTFKARPEITLTPAEFQRFNRALVGMLPYILDV